MSYRSTPPNAESPGCLRHVTRDSSCIRTVMLSCVLGGGTITSVSSRGFPIVCPLLRSAGIVLSGIAYLLLRSVPIDGANLKLMRHKTFISLPSGEDGIIDSVEEPGRTKSEDTRERILVAAIQRFSNFGYRRTSISDVAEEAGLARATVYLYWKRKEDLFVAGLERFHAYSQSLAEKGAATEGTAAERIQGMILSQYRT